jgi:DNA-binding GntR family transcriptional regulator
MIVREAFKQLVTEGFLKAEPRRGVSVAHLTADEAREMTEIRSLIESKALEWAIPQMSKADLETAARILGALDKARSTDRIISLNVRFHEALYVPARKERTMAMIGNLRMNFERYLRFTRKRRTTSTSRRENTERFWSYASPATASELVRCCNGILKVQEPY